MDANGRFIDHVLQHAFHGTSTALAAFVRGFTGILDGVSAKEIGFFHQRNLCAEAGKLPGCRQAGDPAPNDHDFFGFNTHVKTPFVIVG
jgi:hypothetical protein